MVHTTFLIIAASPILSSSLRSILARQMAASIYWAPIDIDNDEAVAKHLIDAGFGAASVSNLMDHARLIAKSCPVGKAMAAANRLVQ